MAKDRIPSAPSPDLAGTRPPPDEVPTSDTGLNVPLGDGADPALGSIASPGYPGPAPAFPPLPGLFSPQMTLPPGVGTRAPDPGQVRLSQPGRVSAISDEQLSRETFKDIPDDVLVDFWVYRKEDDGELHFRGKMSNVLMSDAKAAIYDIVYGGSFAFKVLDAETKRPRIPLKGPVNLPGPKPPVTWRFGAKMITKEEIGQGVVEALRSLGIISPGTGQPVGVPNPIYGDVVGNMRHELSEARAENARLRDKIEVKDQEIRRIELAKVGVDAKVAQLESDLRRADSDVKAAESEIGDLREKIEKMPGRESESSSVVKVLAEAFGRVVDGGKKDDGALYREIMAQSEKNLDRVLDSARNKGTSAIEAELPKIIASYSGIADSYRDLATAQVRLMKGDTGDKLIALAERLGPALIGGIAGGGQKKPAPAQQVPVQQPPAALPPPQQQQQAPGEVSDAVKAQILGTDLLGKAWEEIERNRPAPAQAAAVLWAAISRIRTDGMLPHLDGKIQAIIGMIEADPVNAMTIFAQRAETGIPIDYAQTVGAAYAQIAQKQATGTPGPSPEAPVTTGSAPPPPVAPAVQAAPQAPAAPVAAPSPEGDGKPQDGGPAVVGKRRGRPHRVGGNGGGAGGQGVDGSDPQGVVAEAVQDGAVDRAQGAPYCPKAEKPSRVKG